MFQTTNQTTVGPTIELLVGAPTKIPNHHPISFNKQHMIATSGSDGKASESLNTESSAIAWSTSKACTNKKWMANAEISLHYYENL